MGAQLTPHEERLVAARAVVDPRTVRAYLNGRRQHSTTSARIAQALRDLEREREGSSVSARSPG
jgi:hypothetical protein